MGQFLELFRSVSPQGPFEMHADNALSPVLRRRLDEAIAEYLAAAESGTPPDREAMLARYGDVAEHLRSFFAAQDTSAASGGRQPPDNSCPNPQDQGADAPRSPADAHGSPADAPRAPSLGSAAGDAVTIDSAALAPSPSQPQSAPSIADPTRRFGDYELLEEIARGGMGVVWKARHVKLQRIVAIKMILAGQLAGPDDVQRFYAEAEAAAQLDHPGIVPKARAGETAPLRLLHPLLIYDGESGEVSFLNGRHKQREAEYLCYTTGRQPSERRSLGEFELLSRIGRGGMGVVYRAWQPSLGRQVALKSLLRSGDPKAEARFAREIRALGRVDHPNLVKIHTSGAEDDQWFYAMELVEGADLAAVCEQLGRSDASTVSADAWERAISTACERVRSQEEILSGNGRSPASPRSRASDLDTSVAPDTADAAPDASDPATVKSPRHPRPSSRGHIRHVVEIVRQAAEAAHSLHEAGVVHRDIKPGNIMLAGVQPLGCHAVLMDLGLAQLADDAEGRLTRTRQFVGTLRYASPEQLLAAAHLDRRADVYSLGATLWELLTLRPLFGAGEQTPTPELMLKVQSTEPDRLRKHNPHVPGDLEAIVLKCLEKDRSRRYPTAAELAADLTRWTQGQAVSAQLPTLRYVAGKFARRYWKPLCAAAGMLAAAVLGVIVLLGQMRAAREENDRRRAESLVEAVLTAPPDAVRYATESLLPLRRQALPILRERFTDDGRDKGQRLHAALALASLGEVDVAFLIDAVVDSPSAESRNIVTALATQRETVVPQVTARAA